MDTGKRFPGIRRPLTPERRIKHQCGKAKLPLAFGSATLRAQTLPTSKQVHDAEKELRKLRLELDLLRSKTSKDLKRLQTFRESRKSEGLKDHKCNEDHVAAERDNLRRLPDRKAVTRIPRDSFTQALWEHEHLRSWFNYGDDPVGGPTASRIFASGAETDTTARTGASSANSSTIASS